MNITHVCQTDVGNFDDTYGDWSSRKKVKNALYGRAKKASEAFKIPLIQTESNYAQLFLPLNGNEPLRFAPLTLAFSILCLRKAWSIYYMSCHFNLELQDIKKIGVLLDYCESFVMDCISYDGFKVIVDGVNVSREEKIATIADNAVAQKYLHSCLSAEENCGACNKCLMTLFSLDAHGKLDLFRESFDIDKYRSKRKHYLKWLDWNYRNVDSVMYREFYDLLKCDPDYPKTNLEYTLINLLLPVYLKMPSKVKNMIKGVYHAIFG